MNNKAVISSKSVLKIVVSWVVTSIVLYITPTFPRILLPPTSYLVAPRTGISYSASRAPVDVWVSDAYVSLMSNPITTEIKLHNTSYMQCATSPEVAEWIPDGVIEIFH